MPNSAPTLTVSDEVGIATDGERIILASAVVTDSDGDNLDCSIDNPDSTKLDVVYPLPSGWVATSTGGDALQYACSGKTPSQLQADLRAITFSGVADGSVTLTITVDDGTDTDEETVDVTIGDMSDSSFEFDSTDQWDDDTAVLIFEVDGQLVSPDGSLVEDTDTNRNAAAQSPSGTPGGVQMPEGATAGLHVFAKAYPGPIGSLTTNDEPFYGWGDDTDTYIWDGESLTTGPEVFADAEWTYSNGTSFCAFNGISPTDIETDIERDGSGSAQFLEDAGNRGDNYINRALSSRYTVPLSNMDAFTAGMLQDLSNRAARWQLAESHQFGLMTGQTIAADAEAAIAKADKKYVDDELAKILDGKTVIVADLRSGEDTEASGIESVALDFGDEITSCDEFGCSY